jgi:thiosulfate/3-mercaptopyruvate sulfurtransferase
MGKNISPLIKVKELLKLTQNKNLVIVHAGNGEDAQYHYNKEHLNGALFVDLNTQLSDIKQDASIEGRHPLASDKQFSEVLTYLGIIKKSHIVIYDDQNGANAASRFWWMLRSVGHKKVQVLNGGFHEAKKEGFPINLSSA